MSKLARIVTVLTVASLLISLTPTNSQWAAQAQVAPSAPYPQATQAASIGDAPPAALPGDCLGVTPPGETPPACCLYGYVYYNGAPVTGASVTIQSRSGSTNVTTASGGASSKPYYSLGLSAAPLSVSSGDVITITATYSGMVSARTWVAQSSGQQVDLGLINGYRAPGPMVGIEADQPAAHSNAGLLTPATISAQPEYGNWWATVQDNLRREEYQVTWQVRTDLPDVPAAYHAPNRAHNLRTYFTPDGIRVIPRAASANWEWGLQLTGYGYADNIQPVDTLAARTVAAGNRFEYHSPSEITEWYVNDKRGLEQGFTLNPPPVSLSPDLLVLEMALSGNLMPYVTDDGSAIEFATAGGVHVLRYGDLHVYDTTGRQLGARLDVSGLGDLTRLRIIADAASAVYPITVDPLIGGLSTTASWTADGNQAGAHLGYSVATAGDVNGDGYSDIIVGAPQYDNGQTDEGRAYVYYGSASGLSVTANWIAESDQANAYFGTQVNAAGDVNGDGYADIIVGSPSYSNGQSEEGRAYAYYGSAAGPSATANWIAEGNRYGLFGQRVGTAGDVNGDGYADIIVGAPRSSYGELEEGRAFVYHGSASGLSCGSGCPVDAAAVANWTAESNQAEAYFSCSVGTAGDVNGDGYADVIIGSDFYDNGQTDEGRVYVYHGSASGLSATANWMAESNQTNAYLGRMAGTAGDVNGDGYADVILGAYTYDNDETDEGRAFVFYGSATGLACGAGCPVDASVTANWMAEGNQVGAQFGIAERAAGDVNGDGYADIIVGANLYDIITGTTSLTDAGQVYVYYGAALGLSTTANWIASSDQVGAQLGWAVATAGDVNGDGYSDVIIGSYLYDITGMPMLTDAGRVYVYHGSSTGLACGAGCPVDATTAANWIRDGVQSLAYFGTAVSTAGDVNGDGYYSTFAMRVVGDAINLTYRRVGGITHGNWNARRCRHVAHRSISSNC